MADTRAHAHTHIEHTDPRTLHILAQTPARVDSSHVSFTHEFESRLTGLAAFLQDCDMVFFWGGGISLR